MSGGVWNIVAGAHTGVPAGNEVVQAVALTSAGAIGYEMICVVTFTSAVAAIGRKMIRRIALCTGAIVVIGRASGLVLARMAAGG